MTTHPPVPRGLAEHLEEMVRLGGEIAGHLTEREIRFLALLGAMPACAGEVLEIGSYKGKSTVILARSAAFAGQRRIVAVDPLDLPAETDPTEVPAGELAGIFRDNIRAHGVEANVEFHAMRSEQLARNWDRPLRLLWIDGDHTWQGARADVEAFARHLAPGGIIAFHDVLHRYEGPVRALSELVLSSPLYGAAGVVGSIGWAQFLGSPERAQPFAASRERLRGRLAALVPFAARGTPRSLADKLAYKLRRSLVPHDELEPAAWAAQVVSFA